MKKKIAFLFGAGAEGRDNFEISTGYEFLRKSLFANKTQEGFRDALKLRFSKTYFNNSYSYSRHFFDAQNIMLKNFVINKLLESPEFLENYRGEISCLLDDSDVKEINETLESNSKGVFKQVEKVSNKNIPEEYKKDFYEVITGKIERYEDISSPMIKALFCQDKDGKIKCDMNIGVAGTLDSYFHTIIAPSKYGSARFSKVFNYYWACYFTILEDIFKFFRKQNNPIFNKYITNEKLDYKAVLCDLPCITYKLYSEDLEIPVEGSYYGYIENELWKRRDDIECKGVVTTNYYKFCSKISNNTIFLNGQLKLFEYPESLEVNDITLSNKVDSADDRIFFPFILGQSLVKPIISAKQVHAFAEFENLLFSASGVNTLIILGYNINEDDNHINTFLHDFVKQGNKLIVVTKELGEVTRNENNFQTETNTGELKEKKLIDICNRLKCNRSEVNICFCKYGKEFMEHTVHTIFSYI